FCADVRPAQGIFAITGNHDSDELCELTAHLPLQWLNDATVTLPNLPIEMMGLRQTFTREPDSVALLLKRAAGRATSASDVDAPAERAASQATKARSVPRAISSSASGYEAQPSARDERDGARATPIAARSPARVMRFLLAHSANM